MISDGHFVPNNLRIIWVNKTSWVRMSCSASSLQDNFKALTLGPQKRLRLTHTGSDSDKVLGDLYPCAFVTVPATSHLTSQLGSAFLFWLFALGQAFFFYKSIMLPSGGNQTSAHESIHYPPNKELTVIVPYARYSTSHWECSNTSYTILPSVIL